jgi:hypothetical protein
VSPFSIEHWRDGERIASFDLTEQHIEWHGGVARVVLPPGMITLTTDDELRFDVQALIRFLQFDAP